MLLSLVGFTIALAASGGLDTTFSGDGKQTTDFAGNWGERLNGIALQSDGKIVAVGSRFDPANSVAYSSNFALARYNTDGSLDTSFSGDGKQVTDFGRTESGESVAIQSDGKIVVAGSKCNGLSACDLGVARYNANGSLDTTFSGDGRQVVGFGSGDNGTYGGLAIQSNGKIVIAGYMYNSSGNSDFAVYRLDANGSLDTTFGGDGKVNYGFGGGRVDWTHELLLQGGKIVVVGTTCDGSFANCDFAVARLTSAGALDASFSGDGKQTADFGGSESGWAVAAQADGKLVVVGDTYTAPSTTAFALARFNADGSLDTSINGTGKRTFSLGNPSRACDVLVQPGGKIVVAGEASNGSNSDFALARLNSNGALDATFSGDGKLLIGFAGQDDWATSLVRQANGRYVLGGTATGASENFGLARVLP
jgi:uncharacterized delta-60 repeat protein